MLDALDRTNKLARHHIIFSYQVAVANAGHRYPDILTVLEELCEQIDNLLKINQALADDCPPRHDAPAAEVAEYLYWKERHAALSRHPYFPERAD